MYTYTEDKHEQVLSIFRNDPTHKEINIIIIMVRKLLLLKNMCLKIYMKKGRK